MKTDENWISHGFFPDFSQVMQVMAGWKGRQTGQMLGMELLCFC
jgi:hypothetical protein